MSGLARLWRLFTDAPADVTDPERRRQVQLLSGLLIVLAVSGLTTAVLQWLLLPGFGKVFAIIAAAALVLLVTYVITRRGFYTVGAMLAIAVTLLASFAVIWVRPDNDIALAYLVVNIFLARLFFAGRGVLILAAVNLFILIVVLPALGVVLPYGDSIAVSMFIVIFSTLLLVAMHYRNAIERDRRAQLIASEQQLRTIAALSPVGVYRTDTTGSCIYVNEAWCAIAGLRAEQAYGQGWVSALHPDDCERVMQLWSTAAGSGAPFEAEYRFRTADGTIHWLLGRAVPERDEHGAVCGYVGSITDISARKQAEGRVAQLNRLLRTISEINQMLVRETAAERVLAETCRILVEHGEYRMAWIGLADFEAGTVRSAAQAGVEAGYLERAGIRCDDSPAGRGPTGTAIRTGRHAINNDTGTNAEFALWRAPAQRLGFRSSAAFALRVENRTIGAINVYAEAPQAFGPDEVALLDELADDIGYALQALENRTRRRQAEAALRANEAQLREAQRLARLGSWELDLVNNKLEWSDEIYRIFEIDPRMFGASYEAFLEVIHPEDRELVNRAYTESVSKRTRYDVVHRLLMKDGRVKYVQERGETFYGEHGRPLRSAGTVQDITEMRRAEQALIQSESNFRALTENANVGILVNHQGRHVFANNKLLDLLGYTLEELGHTGVKELVHPQEYDKVMARFRARLDGKPVPGVYETVFMTKAGQALPVELTAAKTTWQGEPAGLVFLHDIRERLRAEDRMRKLSSALEQTADSVVITDRQGVIEYVNLGFEKTTGYSRDEAIGQTPRLLKSGKQGAGFYKKLWETILAGEVFNEVFVNRRKDGSLYYAEETISPLKDPAGRITHFVATSKDVTERMQTQERLQHMAQHDALTELPNRALFLDRLKQALARARWHERLVAVLFVDMDRFKTINDTLGHEAGDRLLQALAERLTASVREGDTVARFGGDEFVILLDDVGSDKDIGAIAQKVIETLAPPFAIDGQSLYVTASIGVSLYPNDGEDSGTLLKNADIAMYRAKDLGKNTYQFYSADMSARAFERLTLESSLRHAIERNEFRLYYQPQIDTASGAILGVEALLRWQHPDFGLVAPAEFIPLLEETGLIVPVGEWVFHTACAQLCAWHAAGWPTLRMAVNLSPRQFQAAGLAMMVERALAAVGCDPGLIELEITENVLLRHTAATLDALDALRALGVRMAIDDFGTGYSSLSYLRRYAIDTLKIDRSFVHDVPGDADDSALASAIIVLAQSLKLDVIAEGVETGAQRDFLRERGCRVMQGYLFSRPLPADGLTTLLGEQPSQS